MEEVTVSSERILRWLGILGPIRAFPALLATVGASIAALEIIWLALPAGVLGRTPASQLLVVVGGALIGLIAHRAANFWDSKVFNRRYGINGSWLGKRAGLFPSGLDLARARDSAVEAIFESGHSGVGVYRESIDRVRKDAKKWHYVQQPLVLSKFARSFIWPAVVAAVGLLAVAVISFLRGNSILVPSAGMALSLAVGVLLFVPYLDLRVEHMIRLYRAAARTQEE